MRNLYSKRNFESNQKEINYQFQFLRKNRFYDHRYINYHLFFDLNLKFEN